MRGDLQANERHEAGFNWACRIESEVGIHGLVGYQWDVWNGIHSCDTAWMLAYVCPRTWSAARSAVLRAIAGVKTRPGIKLLTTVSEIDRGKAREALGIN